MLAVMGAVTRRGCVELQTGELCAGLVLGGPGL